MTGKETTPDISNLERQCIEVCPDCKKEFDFFKGCACKKPGSVNELSLFS